MIIKGHELEYIHEEHLYIVDGIIVPSVTQILQTKFGNKYKHVSKRVLKQAADKGTAVHNAIERFERYGEESKYIELHNYKFLRKQYGFKCVDNEVAILLFDGDKPVAAGRLDMVLEMDGKTGLADIKRTSTLDKNYIAYQLNLYRIGYQQCYGKDIEFLKGLHLREDIRRFVDIPINEEIAWQLIRDYKEAQKWQ